MKVSLLAVFLLFYHLCTTAQDFSLLDKKLDQYKQQMGGNAVMIIYTNGKLVYNKNIGSYTNETAEKIASSSKWLSAACIMTLVDDGKLQLDDHVAKYIPAFNKAGFNNITLRQCLSHTTGLRPTTKKGRLSNLFNKNSLREMVESMPVEQEVYAKPGTSFLYGNTGLLIAGRVAEVVSGKDWQALFAERIANPCNMKHTYYANGGAFMIAGSVTSTPADYMHFLQMILNKGKFNNKTVLSAASIKAMQQSQTAHAQIENIPTLGEGFEYGLGEWVMEKDTKGNTISIGSPGLFGCWPMVHLQKQYALLLFVKNIQRKGRKEMMNDLVKTVNNLLP